MFSKLAREAMNTVPAMSPTEGLDAMKVGELRAQLKEFGLPTAGNKSTLLDRLRRATDGDSGELSDALGAVSAPISKAEYDSTHAGNAVYDWASAVLSNTEMAAEHDVPASVKLARDNHPDMAVIKDLLKGMEGVDFKRFSSPSPTEIFDKLRKEVQKSFSDRVVTCPATADLLGQLGVDGNADERRPLLPNEKMEIAASRGTRHQNVSHGHHPEAGRTRLSIPRQLQRGGEASDTE
jgi:hypothetical protein